MTCDPDPGMNNFNCAKGENFAATKCKLLVDQKLSVAVRDGRLGGQFHLKPSNQPCKLDSEASIHDKRRHDTRGPKFWMGSPIYSFF